MGDEKINFPRLLWIPAGVWIFHGLALLTLNVTICYRLLLQGDDLEWGDVVFGILRSASGAFMIYAGAGLLCGYQSMCIIIQVLSILFGGLSTIFFLSGLLFTDQNESKIFFIIAMLEFASFLFSSIITYAFALEWRHWAAARFNKIKSATDEY